MHKKRNRFILRLMADFMIALACVGIFLLFFYVLPRKAGNDGMEILDIQEMTGGGFELPGMQNEKDDEEGRQSAEKKDLPHGQEREGGTRSRPPGRGKEKGADGFGNGNSNTRSIPSDKEIGDLEDSVREESEIYSCKDESLQITIKKTQLGEGDDTITYYTADIYLSSIEQLGTAFAEGSYGKNIRESTLAMAEANQAILAISGDSYGNSEKGVVVRNGKLYRQDVNDAEICVLFYDGTMEIYAPEEFSSQEVFEKGVWQAWNFGPSLLENGEIKESFRTNSYLNGVNPRCGIGYIAPGHYKFVVVDGRDTGYSRGVTMSEFARIMKEEGCILAYNLDGGKSSAMVWQDSYVNQQAGGGRDISDIIYIRKEISDD